MTTQPAALQILRDAAAPFRLQVVRTTASPLPELVLIRVEPDGRPVARLQYAEPSSGSPVLRTLIQDDLSASEQAVIERHVEERLAPVIRRIFSYVVWTSLVDE